MHTIDSRSEAPVPVESRGDDRLRLDFLDGIRGLSALYVALYHITYYRHSFTGTAKLLTQWMDYGHYAVCVFIVLSGYCLMLPVVRSDSGRLPGGFPRYIKRRALRILPPYYVVVIITACLIGASRWLRHHGSATAMSDPMALTPGSLITHLLLVHNFSPLYMYSICGVLWTVAVEWQCYILFPLLLLPIWRRFGILAAVAAAFVVSLTPIAVLPKSINLQWSYPWFLGLFALGMAAAAIGFSCEPYCKRLRTGRFWGVASLLALIVLCVCQGISSNLAGAILLDICVGIGSVCLILYCARPATSLQAESRSKLALLLEQPFLTGLGGFSYSLYLIHLPIIWMFEPFVNALHMSSGISFFFALIVILPTALFGAWGFSLLVEKPFLSRRSRT